MRIKGLCQAARPTGITARKATRRRGSSSLCAEEGDAVPDTVTHCVCVKDGSWRASSSGRLPPPLSYPDPVASCTIVGRKV